MTKSHKSNTYWGLLLVLILATTTIYSISSSIGHFHHTHGESTPLIKRVSDEIPSEYQKVVAADDLQKRAEETFAFNSSTPVSSSETTTAPSESSFLSSSFLSSSSSFSLGWSSSLSSSLDSSSFTPFSSSYSSSSYSSSSFSYSSSSFYSYTPSTSSSISSVLFVPSTTSFSSSIEVTSTSESSSLSFSSSSLSLSSSSPLSSIVATSSSLVESSTTSVENGKTLIIDRTTTIYLSQSSTLTSSSITSATPTLANNSVNSHGLTKKNKNIVIGVVVGVGVPLILASGFLISYIFFKKKGKLFINSDGELVQKNSEGEEMIDDKFFDDTVADGDDPNTTNRNSSAALTPYDYDDDTVVHRNLNNAVNF